jgi:hypothetical protein
VVDDDCGHVCDEGGRRERKEGKRLEQVEVEELGGDAAQQHRGGKVFEEKQASVRAQGELERKETSF